jgi:hypothetical protein
MVSLRDRKRVAASMWALLASMLLTLGVVACGSAGKAPGSALQARSQTGTVGSGEFYMVTTSVIPPGQSLRGDSDADNPSDTDGNGDVDKDGDNDNPTPQSYKFPDEDDKATFAYGHPTGTAEGRTIKAVVQSYYAAAAKSNGVAACALLYPSLAGAIAEDYGQAGPAYLRGGKTCQAVMSMLFKHSHEELAEAITVVDVRLSGERAQAILSSRSMPASNIFLHRNGDSWKVDSLLGKPLP